MRMHGKFFVDDILQTYDAEQLISGYGYVNFKIRKFMRGSRETAMPARQKNKGNFNTVRVLFK